MTAFVDLKTVSPSDVDEFPLPDLSESEMPVVNAPITRQSAAEYIGKSDMTVGRWIKELAQHGLNCTNTKNKITPDGFAILWRVKTIADSGEQVSDAIQAVASEINPVTKAEVEVANLADTSEALQNQYTALAVSRKYAIQSRSELFAQQEKDALQALESLMDIKQTELDIAESDLQAKHQKWRAEAAREVVEEYQFKLGVKAELTEKLGLI